MKGSFRELPNGNLRYSIPIREGSAIHSTLGEIRKKNDGRYFWYRKTSDFAPDWIGSIEGNSPQGTEDTLELAKMRMLQGWGPNET